MDKQKILEYALHGANEKAFDYLKKRDKSTSAIKYDTFNKLYEECAKDAEEIKNILDNKK